ncbi:hypothetical protein M9Y10_013676 [Tritrichomonas musculus]|uniref:Protein kinase domain-containing protein n=1 Tax=Tritrichomonas musculus TaxID=1915356 RepID=A0ABR2KYA0_9EUKA
MSPELLRDETNYDSSVDVYAFAILAYEIVSSRGPYSEDIKKSPLHLLGKIMDGHRPKKTSNITDKMKDLLCRCWSDNIKDRPSLTKFVNW